MNKQLWGWCLGKRRRSWDCLGGGTCGVVGSSPGLEASGLGGLVRELGVWFWANSEKYDVEFKDGTPKPVHLASKDPTGGNAF